MNFEVGKEKTLKKMREDDRSNKGSVDKLIKPLLDVVNKSENYYSTSSCSGRVIVISIHSNGSKRDAEFIYRTHEEADSDEIIKALKSLDTDDAVWFRQEPAIIHVCARTLKDASNFLKTARVIGFKRCGLFEVDKRFMMELVSTEKIDTIIANKGKILVSDEYVKVLVLEANKKLKKTWDKTNKLEKDICEFM